MIDRKDIDKSYWQEIRRKRVRRGVVGIACLLLLLSCVLFIPEYLAK